MQELIHTPDGVRDIYDGEFAAKLEVEERIRKVLRLYGCSELSTPAFEFFDVFSRERGSVPSRELFKFFDREGNTLVLRPDMTPPAARCAAKYYMDEKTPIRLSYLADTFINHGNYQGRLKEVTVQGAEFIGDGSVNEDAELLALTIECLLASGLTKFQVDVGEVGFFAGLVDEAGLSAETEQTLRALIEDKNFFGVEEKRARRRRVLIAVIYLAGAVAGVYAMLAVPYFPGRAMFGSVACALIAVGTVCAGIRFDKKLPQAACGMLLAGCVLCAAGMYAGTYARDRQAYRAIQVREAYILQEKAAGNYDLILPAVRVQGDAYSPYYGLADIEPNPQHWANTAKAQYYGLNSITLDA